MVRTNASAQFQSDYAFNGVINWFNRRSLPVIGATQSASTTSTAYVELHSGARGHFLSWGEEAVHFGISGYMYGITQGWSIHANIGVNGATSNVFVAELGNVQQAGTTNYYVPVGGFIGGPITEGWNYITPTIRVGAAGGTQCFANLAVYAMIRG